MSLEYIKKQVEDQLDLKIEGRSRRRIFVDAKKIYAKIAQLNGFSSMKIGDSIDRDHATVLHYWNEHENLMRMDQTYRKNYYKCLVLIGTSGNNYNLEDLKEERKGIIDRLDKINSLILAIESKK